MPAKNRKCMGFSLSELVLLRDAVNRYANYVPLLTRGLPVSVVWIPVALYCVVQVLAQPSVELAMSSLLQLAFPFYLIGTWRGFPSALLARWTLIGAYGVLALFFATLGALILVKQGPFGVNPIPGVALVLMATIFLVQAALFTAVWYFVTFPPSVRDFWNYRAGAILSSPRK
jgi:hypothetical protein